jgi:hypothetical protein
MFADSLTDRQLATLLIVEEEFNTDNSKITPHQCADLLGIDGVDAARTARSLLDQLKKKGFVEKRLCSGGMGKGLFSQYWLSQSGQEFLAHRWATSPTMATKNSRPPLPSANNDCAGTVYFIGNANSGPVKIGFTSHSDPKHRLSQLQTASPDTLKVLGEIGGTIKVERRIHSFLLFHNVRGEWFEREPALALLNHLLTRQTKHVMENFDLEKWSDSFRDKLFNIAFKIEGPSNTEDKEKLLATNVARHVLLDLISTFNFCKSEKPLPFLAWLFTMKDIDTATGDLARDALLDESFPSVGSLTDYLSYGMEVSGKKEVTRAIIDAWVECQQAIMQLDLPA